MAYKKVNKDKMKEQLKPELNWVTKKHATAVNGTDVSIKISGKGKAQDPAKSQSAKVLTCIFRNNLYKQFDSEFLMFAVLKNRLYFKGTTAGMGYKITQKSTSGYLQATLQKEEIAEFEAFAFQRDFSLKYDDFMEMYYVQLASTSTSTSNKNKENADQDVPGEV